MVSSRSRRRERDRADQGDLAELPEQPDGRGRRSRDVRASPAFAREHDLLLLHDAAYSEITFDGYVAPSALQAQDAKDVAVEFGSASKSYNMTGWRIGWAAGSAEAIRALGVVKTNLDSGQSTAIQRAAIAALAAPEDQLDQLGPRTSAGGIWWSERSTGSAGRLPPLGSCYVWAPVPEGDTSASFADRLLDTTGVFVAPGSGYGGLGEGFVRFSLTVPDDRLAEAMDRIARALA